MNLIGVSGNVMPPFIIRDSPRDGSNIQKPREGSVTTLRYSKKCQTTKRGAEQNCNPGDTLLVTATKNTGSLAHDR